MAGDWIKWAHGFAKKPEVMMIAARLNRTRHEVAGILMEVFEWADANVLIDSGASGFDPDACPGVVQLGDQSKQLLDAIAGVSGLADAMTAVGWLQARSGSLAFPNFGRHNGKSAKARALDSSRKRVGRANGPDENRNSVPDVSGSEPDKGRIREEKRREEEKDTPIPPQAGASSGGKEKPGRRVRGRRGGPQPWAACEPFLRFWEAYPNKKDKPAAWKAWTKLAPDDALAAQILAGLERYKAQKEDWRNWKHPGPWLNARGWEDYPEPATIPFDQRIKKQPAPLNDKATPMEDIHAKTG